MDPKLVVAGYRRQKSVFFFLAVSILTKKKTSHPPTFVFLHTNVQNNSHRVSIFKIYCVVGTKAHLPKLSLKCRVNDIFRIR